MKSVDLNTRLIDNYIQLLSSLSSKAKLALIAKLTKSLKNNFHGNNAFDKAFGAWSKSDDAEKLIDSIKTSRNFKRNTVDL